MVCIRESVSCSCPHTLIITVLYHSRKVLLSLYMDSYKIQTLDYFALKLIQSEYFPVFLGTVKWPNCIFW
jgi:hypothetical protein